MIKVKVAGREATVTNCDPLTTGSIGIDVSFSFSEDWDGLARTAVFQAGDRQVDVFLTASSCAVPAQLLTEAGHQLLIGVYGTDGIGELILASTYANAGRISIGAELSGNPPAESEPALIDQVLRAANGALSAANEVRQLAADGAFNGAKGDKGDAFT